MSKTIHGKTVLPPEPLRAKRAAATVAGQERKKIYIVDKKILLEKEKDNYTKLMLLKCPDGWWKMFGHSALFYANSIAMKLGLKANIQTDGDYTAKSENGFVSVKGLGKMEDALKMIGVYKVRIKNKSGDFVHAVSERGIEKYVR